MGRDHLGRRAAARVRPRRARPPVWGGCRSARPAPRARAW